MIVLFEGGEGNSVPEEGGEESLELGRDEDTLSQIVRG